MPDPTIKLGQAVIEQQGDTSITPSGIRIRPLTEPLRWRDPGAYDSEGRQTHATHLPRATVGPAVIERVGNSEVGPGGIRVGPVPPEVSVGPAVVERRGNVEYGPDGIGVGPIQGPTVQVGEGQIEPESPRVQSFDERTITVFNPQTRSSVKVARTPGLERLLGVPADQPRYTPTAEEQTDRQHKAEFERQAAQPIPPNPRRQAPVDRVVPSGWDLEGEDIAMRQSLEDEFTRMMSS